MHRHIIHPRCRRLVLGLLGLALVACGDDASGGSGGSGGATGEGGGVTSANGGGGHAGGSDGGRPAVDPSTLPDAGAIQVYQFGQDNPQVSASFQRGRPIRWEDRPDCDVRPEGPCTLIRCDDEAPVETAYLDAGAFALTGTLIDVAPERDERGLYSWEGQGLLFAPSATLEASFSGAEVEPFQVALQAPPQLTAFEPSFGDLVVTPGQDLQLTWTLEGTGGVVQVWLGTDLDDGSFHQLECRFDAEDLAATIPGHLLALEGQPFAAFIATVVEEHVAVQSHDVTLFVMNMAEVAAFTFAE